MKVGLGDNIYIHIKKGVLTKTNAQWVEKVVQLAEILNREVAAPDDDRGYYASRGKINSISNISDMGERWNTAIPKDIFFIES